MKTKTILELLTLSAGLYHLAKDTHLLEKINEYSEKGKDSLNRVAADPLLDEDGNELELMEKIMYKAGEMKQELELKIEEMVAAFYKKINVAHLDEINALNAKLEKADTTIALIEARLNRLEMKT
jgi:BMFP domain-containing protein YqiC